MNDSKKICLHCLVSGKVQGVWFRANTKQEADKLGLKGWVRNLSDGRVEVMVSGSHQKVEILRAWLHSGPEKAKVTEVIVNEIDYQVFESFEIN